MTQIERTVSVTSTKLTARSLSCSSTSFTRKQNRSDFAKYYSDLCHIQHSHPLNAIKQNLDKGILDFYCDRIKFDEWWSIINALGSDKTLHLVAIRARHPQKQAIESADTELKARSVVKQPVFATRFVLLWLMESIKLCLSQSTSLAVLELEGLPLGGDYLISLSRGLAETTSLQHLSFYKCNVGDEGAEIICHTVKNLPNILSLDLSYCALTEHGAEVLCEMVKYQKLNRYSEAWKQTLRYRDPDVEAMPGLRRITINGNSDLGDKGIAVLAEEIKDDLWLRALDVQDCGLTDEGGAVLIDLIGNNRNLVIVDGRGNPFMSDEVLTEIMNTLAANNSDKGDTDYRWINKNPNLNKKNFQVANLKPRPWSCHTNARLAQKPSLISGCDLTASSRHIPPLFRTNTVLTQKKIKSNRKPEEKSTENECLRLQLRDFKIALNREIHQKLMLIEENKKLKNLLEECQADKRKLEEVRGNKVLIAEDTLKVLEDMIRKFGMYVSQKKQEEEEETSESTTTRSTTEERDIPELVSNLKLLLKKAASSTDHNHHKNKSSYQKHKEKARHSLSETKVQNVSSENRSSLQDSHHGMAKGETPEILSDKLRLQKQCRWFKNRPNDQVIWEEDEVSSNSSDAAPTMKNNEGNKTKAQVMFMELISGLGNEPRGDGQYKNVHSLNGSKYDNDNDNDDDDDDDDDDDSISDISEYDVKVNEVTNKRLTSNNEENSS